MFRFKQFAVVQPNSAMKVGTDGVLLGAWVQPPALCERVLDIGTGTGLIALMMAQRFESCRVDAVEIEDKSCVDATENFENSDWSERLDLHCVSIQDFVKNSRSGYDLIVSNPPYFTNSLKSPDKNRTTARHNESLPLEVLVECSQNLLNKEGALAVVLPLEEGQRLINMAQKQGFKLSRKCLVYPNIMSEIPKRVLIELVVSNENIETEISSLIIERESRGCYTDEYQKLTKDFYLKF